MGEDKFPKIATDVVIAKDDTIVLIKRKFDPFKGKWALPGGFVEYGETIEKAAVREAKEETGLDIELDGILGVYSDPGRDPRGHVISVVFIASPKKGNLKNKTNETEDAMWALLSKTDGIDFAFDHAIIAKDFKIILMDAQQAE